MKSFTSVVKRFKENPILTKEDIPYEVATVHNAAVAKYDGKYVMLFRSHLLSGRSVIGIAYSNDGFKFIPEKKPFLTPSKECHTGVPCHPELVSGSPVSASNPEADFQLYEEYGVEDPRVTFIDGEYLITYSAYSRYGVRIVLAKTKDFKTVERFSIITEADYRNVVIFPEKINGLYVRLDRPHSEITPWSIWISYSPDLRYWGDSKVVMRPVKYHWDEMKIGPGAPPIKTKQGWLSIYHGVFPTMDGCVYRLGVALHDLKDPSVIIGVGDEWILQPEEVYEITGYVHNVVFTCAAVPEDDGTVKIYWGGADKVMCAGTAEIGELVDLCLNNSRPAL